MEHALLAYLLLLCATGGINSQPLSPDYGQMEDLFITTDRGDTTTTDSGSGDNPSVLLPRCMDVLRPAGKATFACIPSICCAVVCSWPK